MHAGPPSDPISQNRRCGHKAGGCPAAALHQENLLLASCWPELYLGASRAQCGGGSIDCCNRARRALAGQQSHSLHQPQILGEHCGCGNHFGRALPAEQVLALKPVESQAAAIRQAGRAISSTTEQSKGRLAA